MTIMTSATSIVTTASVLPDIRKTPPTRTSASRSSKIWNSNSPNACNGATTKIMTRSRTVSTVNKESPQRSRSSPVLIQPRFIPVPSFGIASGCRYQTLLRAGRKGKMGGWQSVARPAIRIAVRPSQGLATRCSVLKRAFCSLLSIA
ncbi:hypothetical protein ACVMB1_001036 [Bradyrhizobium sp. USDA 4504]